MLRAKIKIKMEIFKIIMVSWIRAITTIIKDLWITIIIITILLSDKINNNNNNNNSHGMQQIINHNLITTTWIIILTTIITIKIGKTLWIQMLQ